MSISKVLGHCSTANRNRLRCIICVCIRIKKSSWEKKPLLFLPAIWATSRSGVAQAALGSFNASIGAMAATNHGAPHAQLQPSCKGTEGTPVWAKCAGSCRFATCYNHSRFTYPDAILKQSKTIGSKGDHSKSVPACDSWSSLSIWIVLRISQNPWWKTSSFFQGRLDWSSHVESLQLWWSQCHCGQRLGKLPLVPPAKKDFILPLVYSQ